MIDTASKEITVEETQELYDFLKGLAPEGFQIGLHSQPKLTSKKVFTIICFFAGAIRYHF